MLSNLVILLDMESESSYEHNEHIGDLDDLGPSGASLHTIEELAPILQPWWKCGSKESKRNSVSNNV